MPNFKLNLTIKRMFIKAKKDNQITQADHDDLLDMINTLPSTGAKEDFIEQLNTIPIVG